MISFLKLSKIIGHRGACGYAPENTLASMHKAYHLGVKWVEFDVMLTADGEPVIIHDESLERTTNGKGLVENHSLMSLKKLDAGSWFSSAFQEEKIPTLTELLACLLELNMGMNVEIKPTAGKEEETAEKTVMVLQRYWPSNELTPLVSSFSLPALKAARRSSDDLLLGFITDVWLEDWQEILKQINAISLHINHEALNVKRVAEIKRSNKFVLAYTVNDNHRAQELFSWGVDAIFTDYPDRIEVFN